MHAIKDFAYGFKRGFRQFGLQVSDAVNFALLSVVYLLGVGPVSILSRLSGKRFLPLEKDGGKTYFVERDMGGAKKEDYLRQF